MSYIRPHYKILSKRIREKRKFIQVIIGPRQVGKTTLINQFIRNEKYLAYYITADNIESSDSLWISQQWNAARIKLKSAKSKRQLIFIIDEIQKIENWSEAVKKEWDYDTQNKINIKVILLGSSTLLVKRGFSESLAGRFEIIYMGHWTYNEINEAFGVEIEKYIWFGGYPGSYQLINDEKRWKEYIKNSLIETTISKDILMMKWINKPALLKQLFELGCLYSGQILSLTKMLGQLQDAGNTVTLSHYLELLDKAGMLTGIQKFSAQPFRQKSSSPKFQVHNSALMSSQMPETFFEIIKDPKRWGRMVEAAVGAHLINFSKTDDYKLFYWRHINFEVDFVLKYKNKVIGIEVKSGTKTRSKGIEIFSKMFRPDKIYIIGEDSLTWQEFLTLKPVELF